MPRGCIGERRNLPFPRDRSQRRADSVGGAYEGFEMTRDDEIRFDALERRLEVSEASIKEAMVCMERVLTAVELLTAAIMKLEAAHH